ncbi:MAG: cbb3-type cytochrome c oxidase subunit I, partial [Bdellovibrionota bacterium]
MADHAHRPGENYLNHEKGLWSWLTSLDHKRIGVMYFITVMLFFLIGGIFALAIRTELFHTGSTIMTAETYTKTMTYHGAVMVFLVIIPGIPAFMGNFFMPMHIGAADV